MYLPRHFAETRREPLRELIRDNPLATLVTLSPRGPEANLIPLQWVINDDDQIALRGHVAKANPVWRDHPADADVLAVFHGPQSYVSPTWYPGKHEHGKAVPTWNYLTVQARGRWRLITEPVAKRALLAQLTQQHEATMPVPWTIDEAPADYIDSMLEAVVGFEIAVHELLGKWKISQNQPVANRQGVITALDAHPNHDAQAMATAMRQHQSEFP